jgi:trk system potassium uptake protein TrkH
MSGEVSIQSRYAHWSRSRILLGVAATIAAGGLLARRADGGSVLPVWLAVAAQAPLLLVWCGRLRGRAGLGAEVWLSAAVALAALVVAVTKQDLTSFFAAGTAFICGCLLIDLGGALWSRLNDAIAARTGVLKILIVPWVGMIVVGTVLLSVPLATQSPVPDYRHNFWLHVLNSGYAAVSAACLVGTTIYGFAEEYTLFGKVVLVVMTQLAGMGFAALGLVVLRPFMQSAIRLRTVLWVSGVLQLAAAAAMYPAWSSADAPNASERIGWSVVHATSALWNSGVTLRANGLASYLSQGVIFVCVTTLAIVGSLSLPVILDLILGHRGRRPTVGKGRAAARAITGEARRATGAVPVPPWRRLASWEAAVAFGLLTSGAVLLFWFETPWKEGTPWRLPDRWIPRRPVDLGENQVAMRDPTGHAERWAMAVFVSATLRSAGLQSIPLSEGAVSWPSCGLLLAWMLVGGSAGGVAGGLRTSWLSLTAICLLSRRRSWAAVGNGPVVRRRLLGVLLLVVPGWLALNALSAAGLGACTEATQYEVILETAAACNSVGLSTGLSLHLTWSGRLVMIGTMMIGRMVPTIFWLGVSRGLTKWAGGGCAAS